MTKKYPHEQIIDWYDRNIFKICAAGVVIVISIYVYVYLIAGVNPVPLQTYGCCDMAVQP